MLVESDFLSAAPEPVPDVLASYRLACCGLKAALHVLSVNGLPAPEVAHIRADGPIGRCCAELTVTPKAPTIEYDGDPADPSCVAYCVHNFEVCFGRCVSDWFGNKAGCDTDPGDCDSILTCPPEEPWEPPAECGKGRTQADEQALILADRMVLSLGLADAWACCISNPAEGCGDCSSPLLQSCRQVIVTEVGDYCEAGCAGSVFKVQIR